MPDSTFDTSLEYGTIGTSSDDSDDITIEMETIQDSFEKSIVRHDYPFADGADLEDMGEKARTINIRCWFWDDGNTHNTYEKYFDLIDLLKTDEEDDDNLIFLYHPKYGTVWGCIESVVVHHNDQVRTAQIDLVFVEQGRTIKAKYYTEPKSSVANQFISGQATQVKIAEKSLLEKISDYTSKITALQTTASSYIAIAKATVNNIMAPVDSLQAAITYATGLPGSIVGSLAGILEKVALSSSSLTNFPARFLSSLSASFDDLLDSFSSLSSSGTSSSSTDNAAMGQIMYEQLTISCAQRISLEAVNLYDTDDSAYRSPEDYPDQQLMNIRELEESLAVVRTWIDRAIIYTREMDELKIMAASLLEQVNAVRLEREKMITVVIDQPIPLHLICLKYGLPHTDAERLLRINRQIRNPNFVSGEIQIYVR